MAPALHSALGNSRVSPASFLRATTVSLTGLSVRQRSEASPSILFLILLNAIAVIPCQDSHLYSIRGPSVTPGGDTQCSPTAQCSPTCSPVSALQSLLSLYTSSLRTSSGKGSIKPLKTNTTKFTYHWCDKLPGLSPQGCADL